MDRRVCEFNGMTFEHSVCQYLHHRYPKAVILNNLELFSDYLGKDTQVDVIMVHERGVFVIEAKNWKKFIKGEISDDEWTGMGKGVNTMKVFSPFNQNTIHVRAMRNAIRRHTGRDVVQFENIVCVPDGTEIDSLCEQICNLSLLGTLIDSLIIQHPVKVDVDKMVDELQSITNRVEG